MMKRKRICFVSDFFVLGGVEKVIIETAWQLSSNYDITIAVLYRKPDPKVTSLLPPNVKIAFLNMPHSHADDLILALPILGGLKLHKALKGEKFDYLISLKPSTIMAGYSGVARKKIYWCHMDKDIMYASTNELNWFRKINKIRLWLGYHSNDAVWTVSPEIAEGLKKAFRLKNVEILPNPINCERITKEALATSPNPLHSKKNIVMVGRLSYEKGFDRVIKALAKEKDFNLSIIGDGDERNKLEDLAKTQGIYQNIIFWGQITNPYQYMKNGSVVICPSREESFGLVILEAMLLKIPVIATATVGARYLLENGKYGYLVENTDEAVSKVVHEYLVNPDEFSFDLDECYERACSFDVCHFTKKLKVLLEECS